MADINQMAAENMQRNDVAAQALEQLYGAMGGVFGAAKKTLEGAGNDAELVKTTQDLAVANSRARTAEFASAIGTNPSAASYALERLVSQSNELFEQKLAAAKEVERVNSNPIGSYIENTLFGGPTAKRYQAIAAQSQAVDDRIKTLNDLTQETAQTFNAIAQPITVESAQAAGRLAKAEIDSKVHQLDLDGLRTNAEGVTKVTQLKNDNMAIALRARDQELQEQQMAIARQNAALQAKSLQLAMAERQDRLNLREEQKASQDNMVRLVNMGREVNGNLAKFRSFSEMQTAAGMDKNLEHLISQQYMAGLAMEQTGRAPLANDPYEAIKYTKASGAKFNDGRQKLLDFTEKVTQQVLNNPQIAPTLKKEADLSKAVNSATTAAANTFMGNITAGTGNIYSPPTNSILLADPTFKSTYIATNILAPMAQGGVDTLQPKNVVNLTVDAVRTGKITMEQANSELGFMAEKIAGYNNETYRYKDTMGLPNMTKVNVPLENTSSFTNAVNRAVGGVVQNAPNHVVSNLGVASAAVLTQRFLGGDSETIVDLRNPVSRSDYLNRRLAQTIPPALRQQAAQQSKTGAQ